jgi:excisionase family DNA binding protein
VTDQASPADRRVERGRRRLAEVFGPVAINALDEYVQAVIEARGVESAQPRLLTVDEAAERLRAKPKRVYDLVEDGRLPKVPDGRRVLIDSRDLDAYLEREAGRLGGRR